MVYCDTDQYFFFIFMSVHTGNSMDRYLYVPTDILNHGHSRALWFIYSIGLLWHSIEEGDLCKWWKDIENSSSSYQAIDILLKEWVIAPWWVIRKGMNDFIFNGSPISPQNNFKLTNSMFTHPHHSESREDGIKLIQKHDHLMWNRNFKDKFCFINWCYFFNPQGEASYDFVMQFNRYTLPKKKRIGIPF